MFKKILNCMLWFFIILLSGTLFLTLINYFDIVDDNIISIMRFILPVISMITGGYRLGKMSDKKGYLEGLKLGGMIILIFMIIVVLLDKITWNSILYYFILLLTSVIGSMFGINRKKNNV